MDLSFANGSVTGKICLNELWALSAALRVLPVRPSVYPVRAHNSKTKKPRKIKIGVDIPQGTSKCSANFQLKRSTNCASDATPRTTVSKQTKRS